MNPELLLIVRRPPGRGHLYRFTGGTVRAGADRRSDLHLPEAGAASLRFERGPEDWRALTPSGAACPIGPADAFTVGPYLIEVTTEALADGPTTDRTEGARLARAIDTERRVRAAGEPSIWVLRGRNAGAALPLPPAATVSCGAAPDDDLQLPDPGLDPRHFTLTATPAGVQLTARAPVRVRGEVVTETLLERGDLVFAGDTICELRMPGDEGDLPIGRPGPLPPERPRGLLALAAALVAIALVALTVAWWGWRKTR